MISVQTQYTELDRETIDTNKRNLSSNISSVVELWADHARVNQLPFYCDIKRDGSLNISGFMYLYQLGRWHEMIIE